MKTVVVQKWEESERGWGVRPDGYTIHLTEADRVAFIQAYWDGMPNEIPDEYSRPSGSSYLADVEDAIAEKITGHGVWGDGNNYPGSGGKDGWVRAKEAVRDTNKAPPDMTGHHKFSELTADMSSERLARINQISEIPLKEIHVIRGSVAARTYGLLATIDKLYHDHAFSEIRAQAQVLLAEIEAQQEAEQKDVDSFVEKVKEGRTIIIDEDLW